MGWAFWHTNFISQQAEITWYWDSSQLVAISGASLRSFLKLDMAWPGIFFAMVCHRFNDTITKRTLSGCAAKNSQMPHWRVEPKQPMVWFVVWGSAPSINFEPTLNHLNHLKPYLSVASRERLTGTGSKASNTGWSCSAAKKCKKTLKPSIWTLAKPWNIAWNARCAWSVASKPSTNPE